MRHRPRAPPALVRPPSCYPPQLIPRAWWLTARTPSSSAGQFQDACSKRYDDTDLIVREIVDHGADSERGILARERLNYIHSHYKISNDDYMYTLSMFVVEPYLWVQKYDWRPFSKVEREATFYMWKEVGEGMGIKDIPDTFEAMCEWSWEYERKNMRHAATNVKVVAPTVDMFLSPFPAFVRPFFMALFPAFMSDRLAEATGFPKAKLWAKIVMRGSFATRAFLVKYFFLPRWTRSVRTPDGPLYGPDGKRRVFMPKWHLYGCTYPNGYDIASLGPTKFAPGKTCPLFKTTDPGPRCTKD